MQTHRVLYEIKDDRNFLVQKIKVFPNLSQACNFIKAIANTSVTTPILEETKKGK